MLLFPCDVLPDLIKFTNENLTKNGGAISTKGELIRWLGIRLAMAVQSRRGDTADYWQKTQQPGYVSVPPNFGKLTNMSRHRFQLLTSCLAMTNDVERSDDPWSPVRPFLKAFNIQRRSKFVSGELLVVDECMSAWHGRQGKYCHEGIPHLTKIPRKPEGIGAELKAVACSTTGLLLRLEVMEGKQRQSQKPYASEFGEGTAVVLRLTHDFKGSGRTVIGDSAFSSVRTLIALKQRGLYYMGCVKTAHSGFPKKVLESWASGDLMPSSLRPSRGSHLLLESKHDGVAFYALGWLDRKLLTYISNRGTTEPGAKAMHMRHRRVETSPDVYTTERAVLAVERPQMVELFYKAFSTIDVHDLLRQGSLAMEREWKTHKWWHRIFATVFRMTTVDAYLAYRYDCNQRHEAHQEFLEFVDQLAFQLIHNVFLPAPVATRSSSAPLSPTAPLSSPPKHRLLHLKSLPGSRPLKGRAQRRCKLCKSYCSFYCSGCSDLRLGVIFPVCGASLRDCYMEHLLDIFSRSI